MIAHTESDLAANLQTRGCAVCNRVIKIARDFFAQWQYALTSEEESQSSFATELGFCPLHFWQLHSMSSPWGESIGLARLTEHVARLLTKVERGRVAKSKVQNMLRTPENCRVCRMLHQAETAYVKRLGIFVSDKKGRQIYERSQGVCLHHLARLVSVTSPKVQQFLLTAASCRLNEIATSMRGYAKKREATRRDLISKDEEDASLRAVIHLSGAKDYSAHE